MEARRDARKARTWAEVDLGQLRRNVDALRRMMGGDQTASPMPTEIMAVLKADAYGHGAVRVARECAGAALAHFGVASVAECRELRLAGVAGDIYLLSPFLPDEAEAVVRADAIPMVSSRTQWEALTEAAVGAPLPARCFLKIDTGMGRSGCLLDEARALWDQAQSQDSVRITGLATHFSSADEPDPAPSEAQAARFDDFVGSLDALERAEDGRGGRGVWLSVANSPAALRFAAPQPVPGGRGTLVRTGLLLYGVEPFRGALDGTDVAPILSWRARVTLLRELPAGASVGYGRTCHLVRPSRVATLAVGYADGLSRRLSHVGQVLLAGQRLPLLGRISMDQCQADVTDAPAVRLGDTATLLGTDSGATQTVLDMAEQIETTPHEPTCALSRRVPRIYLRT